MGERIEKIGKLCHADDVGALLKDALASNILPITSVCNVNCVFCSHRQNPRGVEAWKMPPVDPGELADMLSLLNPGAPVVIGESVTRILEGEPFTHPRIRDILSAVRRRLPHTIIQITTNGTMLDEAMAAFLRELGQVNIYLSLNSGDAAHRARLMRDPLAVRAVEAPSLLSLYGIDYHGSLVAMPHLTGWEDIESTVRLLARSGAETIRIFMPGFTRIAPEACRFPSSLGDRLGAFVQRLRGEVDVPITLEPPGLQDLKPELAGVIKGSPACKGGLRSGDVLLSINGVRPFSRVHAFQLARRHGNPRIDIRREGKEIVVELKKEAGSRSGLVMDYDLEPGLIRTLGRLHRRAGGPVLVLTSQLAAPLLRAGLAGAGDETGLIAVQPVKSFFFGGSIMSAGLLVVSDYIRALARYRADYPAGNPALVLVPGISFDFRGRDLTGVNYCEIGEQTGLRVEFC